MLADFVLHGLPNFSETAGYHPLCRRIADQSHQTRRAWINRIVKTVTKAGHDFPVHFAPRCHAVAHGVFQIRAGVHPACDVEIQFGALFPRAAVDNHDQRLDAFVTERGIYTWK